MASVNGTSRGVLLAMTDDERAAVLLARDELSKILVHDAKYKAQVADYHRQVQRQRDVRERINDYGDDGHHSRRVDDLEVEWDAIKFGRKGEPIRAWDSEDDGA